MTTESEADMENDDTLEYSSQEEHISEESYIEQIERERDELKETVLRKTAEFENFRRRTLKEKQDR
jgi:molecular chaperone GrpE